MKTEKLGARFCVKGFQGLVGDNAAAPTVQLQSIRIALAVIAHRKWNFRAMGDSRAFLRSKPLERDICETTGWSGTENAAWKLIKPLYGLSTTCKDWYRALRIF